LFHLFTDVDESPNLPSDFGGDEKMKKKINDYKKDIKKRKELMKEERENAKFENIQNSLTSLSITPSNIPSFKANTKLNTILNENEFKQKLKNRFSFLSNIGKENYKNIPVFSEASTTTFFSSPSSSLSSPSSSFPPSSFPPSSFSPSSPPPLSFTSSLIHGKHRYLLHTVICHQGELSHGHYVAYVRKCQPTDEERMKKAKLKKNKKNKGMEKEKKDDELDEQEDRLKEREARPMFWELNDLQVFFIFVIIIIIIIIIILIYI
jgi:hypothetical protein